MKQRKLIIGVSIMALVIAIIFGLNSSVYSANETDRTKVVLEKNSQKDNITHAYIAVFEQESISSFQVSFQVNTINQEDINGVTVDWNSNILKNGILYQANYNKVTKTLNLYVVSKEELTTVDANGNVILDIGDIVIDSKNTKDIQIEIAAIEKSLRVASINHIGKDILVNSNLDKITLEVSKKAEEPKPDPDPDEKPDPNPDPNPDENPDEKPDPNPDEKPDPNPDENPDEKPDPNPDEKPDPNPDENTANNTNTVIPPLDTGNNTGNQNTNKVINNSNSKDNEAQGKLPNAGVIGILTNPIFIIIIVAVIGVLIYFYIQNIKKRR